MDCTFYIPGMPGSKGRPRATKTGQMYTPKKTTEYENYVRERYLTTCPDCYLKGQIKATIIAFYPIPKNMPKYKRRLIDEDVLRPTRRPDLDNIAKIILDSLNKIAYDDDSQVVTLEIRKFYGDKAYVEVMLEEMND
jgi:Holliday junction resolvase RusA-like endonuclease